MKAVERLKGKRVDSEEAVEATVEMLSSEADPTGRTVGGGRSEW